MMTHKTYGISSESNMTKAEAFRWIRRLIDNVEEDKYEVRIVCEFNDTPSGINDSNGYLLIDFSEEPSLTYLEHVVGDVQDLQCERWAFSDPTQLCWVTSCFETVCTDIKIHSKQTLIAYLFQQWCKGRIYDLYAEGY